MISLCDLERLVWNAYGHPDPNTVVLIDGRGKVVQIAQLVELETIVTETHRLIANLGDAPMRASSINVTHPWPCRL